jgi:hypothetical protein
MRKRDSVIEFLDLRRAVEEYPVCRRKFQELIREGRLPAFRLDGKIILKRHDIERLLTAQPVTARLDALVEDIIREVVDE